MLLLAETKYRRIHYVSIMKGRSFLCRVGLLVLVMVAPVTAYADVVPDVPPLMVREIKITGTEFVVLQATADIPDLSAYWIGYTSSDTADPGAIVPTQQLPSRHLASGQAVLMTSDGAEVCDAVLVAKLSVALADTKGTFVVRQLVSSGKTSTFTTIDSVNWAKPSTSGTTTASLDLRKETATMANPVWYHAPSFTLVWRVGNFQDCTISLAPLATTTTAPTETVTWSVPATEPPAIIETGADETVDVTAVDVTVNIGLAPPLITELLPNPLGTGTDATDEYIELYNSNDAVFALAGFTLQTGLSTTHSWVIPAGVTIPPKSFKAFYASESGLSMSNTSGKAALLDTKGTVVAQSDPYDSAPDGQAWALANGAWYWTTKPTPGATNDIAKPIVKPATAAKKLTVKKTTKKSAAVKTASAKKKATAAAQSTVSSQNVAAKSSLHPLVLAVVAVAAIGYGIYEYRYDLANAFHKFKRH